MTYIIWNPKGSTPPSVTFDTREAAETEARRLAEKHRGDFYVCELVSVSSVKAAETTNLVVPPALKRLPEQAAPHSPLDTLDGRAMLETLASWGITERRTLLTVLSRAGQSQTTPGTPAGSPQGSAGNARAAAPCPAESAREK